MTDRTTQNISRLFTAINSELYRLAKLNCDELWEVLGDDNLLLEDQNCTQSEVFPVAEEQNSHSISEPDVMESKSSRNEFEGSPDWLSDLVSGNDQIHQVSLFGSPFVAPFLQPYIQNKFLSWSGENSESLNHLFNDFAEWFAPALKSPYRMVSSDNFKECDHIVLFDVVHLRRRPGVLLPELHLEFNGQSTDFSRQLPSILGNIPVYQKYKKVTSFGCSYILELAFSFYWRKRFPEFHASLAPLLLLESLNDYYNHRYLTKQLKNFSLQMSRIIGMLGSFILRSDTVNFYVIYRGTDKVFLKEHINRCLYMDRNTMSLNRWMDQDLRLYRFLLLSQKDPDDSACFSPARLCDEYSFHDKRSVRALMSLNSSLFAVVSREMHEHKSFGFAASHTSHRFLLHWMAYTTKFKKLNTYCVQALITFHNGHDQLSPTLFDEHSYGIVRLFDILYQRIVQIWQDFRTPSSKFYHSVISDTLLKQIIEYLFMSQPNGILDFPEPRIHELSRLTNHTTLASISRAVHQWHRDAMLKSMQIYDYPELFRSDEVQGFMFTPLLNTDDVINERIEMKHCIGNYNDLLHSGRYAAFKVANNEERATLGIRINMSLEQNLTDLTFDQCFGRYNSHISSKMRKAVDEFMLGLTVLNAEQRP